MKLQTLREGLYMAHFNHIRGGKPLLALNVGLRAAGRRSVQAQTICKIHKGECEIAKGEPCKTTIIGIGDARCSHLDQFNRAVGRRLAFERAIGHNFDRNERAELWAAFLKVEGVPIKSKEKSHVSGHDNKA